MRNPGTTPWRRRSRCLAILFAISTVAWAAACGDGGEPAGPSPEPPNRAPTVAGSIAAQTVTVGESVTVNVVSAFSDPDGDPLSYTASNSPTGVASVSVSGSTLTITGVAAGTATITVTATDPGGLSASLEAAVTVTQANRAPVTVGTIDAVSLKVGGDVTIDLATNFNDPDGDALTYAAESSDTALAKASVSGSEVTVTAVAIGMASVTITASDPESLSATQTVGVTVSANSPPTVVGMLDDQTVNVGDTVTADVSEFFEDPEGEDLAFNAASSDTAVATASVDGSELTVVAVSEGRATITVTATDTADNSNQFDFTVTVTATNRAPAVTDTIPAQKLIVGDTVRLDPSDYFSDPDGDALAYATISSDSAIASTAATDASLTIRGVSEGTATVAVTASDPAGLSATLSAVVTVRATNSAPVALVESGDETVYEGDRFGADLGWFFEDPDDDPLTFSAETTDADVVAVGIVSSFVSTAAVHQGTATVTWTATDPYGQSASIVWSVTVEPADKPWYPHSCTPGAEQPLAMGDSIRGTASPLPQSDCFAIEVGAGQGSAPFRVTAYTVGDTNTEGALFDSNYEDLIDINQDGGQGSNFQVAGMVKAGQYIVVVHAADYPGGEYLLKADDHGDSPATATPVADSAQGSLAAADNADFFRVIVPAAGVLEVSTTGSVNTRGTLYDDLGDILETNDDGGQGDNFLMRHEVQRGDYYVRVEGSTNGSYVFRVEGAGSQDGAGPGVLRGVAQ